MIEEPMNRFPCRSAGRPQALAAFPRRQPNVLAADPFGPTETTRFCLSSPGGSLPQARHRGLAKAPRATDVTVTGADRPWPPRKVVLSVARNGPPGLGREIHPARKGPTTAAVQRVPPTRGFSTKRSNPKSGCFSIFGFLHSILPRPQAAGAIKSARNNEFAAIVGVRSAPPVPTRTSVAPGRPAPGLSPRSAIGCSEVNPPLFGAAA